MRNPMRTGQPMITLSLKSLSHTAASRPTGYLEDVLSHAQVDGDRVLLSPESYKHLVVKYRGPDAMKDGPSDVASPGYGPGTELKALLKGWFGIQATPNCSCNARALEMDKRGIEWCESPEGMATILGWLREEAGKRGLPFVELGAKILVKRAIAAAKRKQKDIK